MAYIGCACDYNLKACGESTALTTVFLFPEVYIKATILCAPVIDSVLMHREIEKVRKYEIILYTEKNNLRNMAIDLYSASADLLRRTDNFLRRIDNFKEVYKSQNRIILHLC